MNYDAKHAEYEDCLTQFLALHNSRQLKPDEMERQLRAVAARIKAVCYAVVDHAATNTAPEWLYLSRVAALLYVQLELRHELNTVERLAQGLAPLHYLQH